MEINYFGHSCFKVKGKNISLVFDPFDSSLGLKVPKLEADVVLTSHSHFDHNNISAVNGYRLQIDNPGEYELNDCFIYGYETFHDEVEGAERGANTIFLVEIDGFTILHLGDLGHELSSSTLEKLPQIDVLMIPVGGVFTINAEMASEVISSLEPSIVIPMHYHRNDYKLDLKLDSLESFLHEMGSEDALKKDKLVLKSKSDLPEETQVLILES